MKIIGVIPARYGSTRLPAKPLADINGLPLVMHTYMQAHKANVFAKIIIATDDKRIVKALEEYHVPVMMTSKHHSSGTERVAEVAEKVSGSIYVNIQGDEPMIPPPNIRRVVKPLINEKKCSIATVSVQIKNEGDIGNSNVVKVVKDIHNNALYFSRAVIPYQRNTNEKHPRYYKHLGLYAYKKKTLMELVELPSAEIELAEKLEQLRWLHHGYSIRVVNGTGESIGVDTPEDLEAVRNQLRKDTP